MYVHLTLRAIDRQRYRQIKTDLKCHFSRLLDVNHIFSQKPSVAGYFLFQLPFGVIFFASRPLIKITLAIKVFFVQSYPEEKLATFHLPTHLNKVHELLYLSPVSNIMLWKVHKKYFFALHLHYFLHSTKISTYVVYKVYF